jgi:excinuclease ABC subunit A
VLQALVDRGHSVVVIEHNLDVLKSADWILEVGPEAGADGGRIVAEGTPETVARADTATSPFLRALAGDKPGPPPWRPPRTRGLRRGPRRSPPGDLTDRRRRENNLKNLSVTIPHRQLTVVTGVSGSGKSTLAFDIVFAEGQRRFMESMSPYARQFVEQLPRPAVDRLTGIPPTVAIEQRVTRGSRKSTVATITEVAQYLRLLYARLGVQHHPDTDRPVTPLSPAGRPEEAPRPRPRHAQGPPRRHLYLCAPLIRGRKGHHQPIATGSPAGLRAHARRRPAHARRRDFQKLDRYKEHDIEVVVADLKASQRRRAEGSKAKPARRSSALDRARAARQGRLLPAHARRARSSPGSPPRAPTSRPASPFPSSTRRISPSTRRAAGARPAAATAGSTTGCSSPTTRMDDPAARLRELGLDPDDDPSAHGRPAPTCHGERLNRVAGP